MKKLLIIFGFIYPLISFADVSLSSESKICQISPIFAGEKLDESKHVCKVSFTVKGPLGKFGSIQVVGELIKDEFKVSKRSGFLIITHFTEDKEDWIKIPGECTLSDEKQVKCLDGGLSPKTIKKTKLPSSSVFPSANSWLTVIKSTSYPQIASFLFPDCRDPELSHICSSNKKITSQDEVRKFEAHFVFYADDQEVSHSPISIQARVHIKKANELDLKKKLSLKVYTDSRFDKNWDKEKISRMMDILSKEATKIYSQVPGLELKVETQVVGSKKVLPISKGQADLLDINQLAESLDEERPLDPKNCSLQEQKDLLNNPTLTVLITESFKDRNTGGVSFSQELTSCHFKIPHVILSKEVLDKSNLGNSSHVFAHEILHSLGIGHIVEFEGLPDFIRDTPECSSNKVTALLFIQDACTFDTLIEPPFTNSCKDVCPVGEYGRCLTKKECIYGYLMFPSYIPGSPGIVTSDTMLRALQHPLVR